MNDDIVILIKSFNRPYYLNRCLLSIQKYVVNSKYSITILDDGTPSKYLKKIEEEFCDITILKSENYKEKATACYQGIEPNTTSIPINLWLEGAHKSSDYFLLLEDDMWLTKPIDLKKHQKILNKENGILLKYIWLANKDLIQNKKESSIENLIKMEPKLYTNLHYLFYIIFRINRFKVRKIFTKLNIYNKKNLNTYYTIYSVAGVLFEKEYFLKLWNNHNNKVNERLQIYNALKFKRKNKMFFRSHEELIKTGFTSAAANRTNNNNKLDMYLFNKTMNESWFKGEFDVMKNFPKDFSKEYICNILKDNNASPQFINDWKLWNKNFVESFESFGCNVE